MNLAEHHLLSESLRRYSRLGLFAHAAASLISRKHNWRKQKALTRLSVNG